jgi:hypothetical protein
MDTHGRYFDFNAPIAKVAGAPIKREPQAPPRLTAGAVSPHYRWTPLGGTE